VERGEEMVELDWLSSKNLFPLRGRDTRWGSIHKFDPEFTAGDVSIKDSERLAGVSTTSTSKGDKLLPRPVPRHLGFTNPFSLVRRSHCIVRFFACIFHK